MSVSIRSFLRSFAIMVLLVIILTNIQSPISEASEAVSTKSLNADFIVLPYNTSLRCPSMIVPKDGQWQPVKEHPKIGNYMQKWATHDYNPRNCFYDEISTASLEVCFAKKNILFVGNSHLRSVAKVFLHLLGLDGERLTTQRHDSHIFERSDGTRVVFLWAPYSFRDFLKNHRALSGTVFHHLYINSGAWDMLFNDTEPMDYVDRLHSDLAALRLQYPKATMTFMNIHTMHPADPTAMGKKAEMVLTCFQQNRQTAYRAMNLCAVRGIDGIEVWDSISLTNSTFARSHVMPDGHHYEPIVNLMMLRVMTNRFCVPPGTFIPSSMFPSYSAACAERNVPTMTRPPILCRSLRYHPKLRRGRLRVRNRGSDKLLLVRGAPPPGGGPAK